MNSLLSSVAYSGHIWNTVLYYAAFEQLRRFSARSDVKGAQQMLPPR
jgi:hypothetical protein